MNKSKDTDRIKLIDRKIRILEHWFEQDQSNITDERLDMYNSFKKMLKDPEYLNKPLKKNKGLIDYDPIVVIDINGVEISGEITYLDKFRIEVTIMSPYIWWKNHFLISGMCRSTPDHFLKTWKKYSVALLRESYEKLKIIDESIDDIIQAYDQMKKELETKPQIKDMIMDLTKAESWFYHEYIFLTYTSNMIATHSERPQIEKILNIYKREKRKIYLP